MLGDWCVPPWLDDDVLDAARALARQQGSTLGAVISDLARESLRSASSKKGAKGQRSGLPLLPIHDSGACGPATGQSASG